MLSGVAGLTLVAIAAMVVMDALQCTFGANGVFIPHTRQLTERVVNYVEIPGLSKICPDTSSWTSIE